eukprot:1918634-Rhodomonas_salina.4
MAVAWALNILDEVRRPYSMDLLAIIYPRQPCEHQRVWAVELYRAFAFDAAVYAFPSPVALAVPTTTHRV